MDEAPLQLETFFDKYSVDIASEGRALLKRLEARVPGTTIMVYDNYNAPAIGFAAEGSGQRGRALDRPLSPVDQSLFYAPGRTLRRTRVAEGQRKQGAPRSKGNQLDDERIDALIDQASAIAQPPIDPVAPGKLLIMSISAKQRPR